MLTGKQRAALRAEANSLDTILHIGKDGITEPVVKQARDALAARELIKCRVLETAMLTAREACDRLAALTESEGVQVIGSRFVLYRENPDKKQKEARPEPKGPKAGGKTALKQGGPGKKAFVKAASGKVRRPAGTGGSAAGGKRPAISVKRDGFGKRSGPKQGGGSRGPRG
ncbi:YhbY family RNA-binding protein [Papillibacter cinnamivorans]|uniref:Putative RNA-binding protein, YhbY family n=1 Tax=Papillibacter cinnamivorans DSM 12816 TaxID=1122930 RepID=A0A1W1ZF07_9FIRM|nr:putative RNA-binding protein, YhbY family [Papillibacter cinnamivorans DSM 12816]